MNWLLKVPWLSFHRRSYTLKHRPTRLAHALNQILAFGLRKVQTSLNLDSVLVVRFLDYFWGLVLATYVVHRCRLLCYSVLGVLVFEFWGLVQHEATRVDWVGSIVDELALDGEVLTRAFEVWNWHLDEGRLLFVEVDDLGLGLLGLWLGEGWLLQQITHVA